MRDTKDLLRYRNESKNIVIPHGFEQPPLVSSIKKSKVLKVVSAGRFVAKKGFYDLIKAADRLQKDNIPAQIELFGSGPLEAELREQINDLTLKNIQLIGWTENLHDEFREADVLYTFSRGTIWFSQLERL